MKQFFSSSIFTLLKEYKKSRETKENYCGEGNSLDGYVMLADGSVVPTPTAIVPLPGSTMYYGAGPNPNPPVAPVTPPVGPKPDGPVSHIITPPPPPPTPAPAPAPAPAPEDDDKKIMGISCTAFTTLLVMFLALWVWALVLVIKNWNSLDTWVKVVSLLLLFVMHLLGPLTPLLVVILVEHTRKNKNL